MSPKNESDLSDALFAIYSRAGREVTYITEKGEERPYWANRFRQALQRAADEDNIVGFVERLVSQPEPSRGFGYLDAADRLDLTVEALVVGEFRHLFSEEVVEIAEERLDDRNYVQSRTFSAEEPKAPAEKAVATARRNSAAANGPGSQVVELIPGSTFTVQVSVESDGTLSAKLA